LTKILLVDDDELLADQLKVWFAEQGHLLESVTTGEDALQMLNSFSFDVILLDWNLPGMSGVDVCKQFRKSGGTSCIILLTGRSDIRSKEEGLDLGADDYLVKPFDTRELSARMRSILRRPAGVLPSELRIGDVSLDAKTQTMTVGGSPHHLAPRECALLEYLMRHPNRIFGSKNLLDSVWPSDKEASTETVRSWMRNLRQKLSAAGKHDLIKTIAGSGYMIEYSKNDQL
jgi:DNA-binding response OmpR family regulator